MNPNTTTANITLASPASSKSLRRLVMLIGLSSDSSEARCWGMDFRSKITRSVGFTQNDHHCPSALSITSLPSLVWHRVRQNSSLVWFMFACPQALSGLTAFAANSSLTRRGAIPPLARAKTEPGAKTMLYDICYFFINVYHHYFLFVRGLV